MTSIGPSDFDPYREQIQDCHCDPCNQVAYAASRAGQFDLRKAAQALLDRLQAGDHTRVERDTWLKQVAADRAYRIAEACRNGASDEQMANLHRGYSTAKMSDFYATGMGLGMSLGRHEAAVAAREAIRAAGQVRRELELARLIAQDPRNACTYFRVCGQQCDHHTTAEGTAP
jgi:hypothetical protein